MKNLLLLLFIISCFSCNAQNVTEFKYDNFENQFLSYEPTQKTQTSKKDFDYANIIIKETKSRTKNNPENFNLADYFNILSAFLTLNESKKNIKTAFEKFKDADDSCEYVLSFENDIKENPKYEIILADYLKKLKDCKQNHVAEEKLDILEYCKINNLNLSLIQKINKINLDDKKYRDNSYDENKSKQIQLDKQNQKEIDSLFKVYKSYLGKTIVGEKFESTMWAVIQHSNIEMMAEYLPIIQKAVKEKQLNVGQFKMLIDRYYGLKYGYQIFGSQSGFGFELANDKRRKEIELKYGIE